VGWEQRPLAETRSHGKIESLRQAGLEKCLKIGSFRRKAALTQFSQGLLAGTLESGPPALLRE
jgi:hypothetical protein